MNAKETELAVALADLYSSMPEMVDDYGCGCNDETDEMHDCPYEIVINSIPGPHCRCCPICQAECELGIDTDLQVETTEVDLT